MRRTVSASFPGPGECANIGPSQRQTLYPELKRWFGIPIPAAEPDDRRPEAELAALNPAIAAKLQMRTIHELLRETAEKKLNAARAELAPAGARGTQRVAAEEVGIQAGRYRAEPPA